MRPWVQPGAVVRLHPLGDEPEGRIAVVHEIRGHLALIGPEKGKNGGVAFVDETLIDVPVKKGTKR